MNRFKKGDRVRHFYKLKPLDILVVESDTGGNDFTMCVSSAGHTIALLNKNLQLDKSFIINQILSEI